MLPDKKRSNRLSSLLSLGSSSDGGSVTSSESTGRLSKVKNRISSTHLAPEYPPPAPPSYGAHQQPTITPVASAPAALEPPPPLAIPRSRNSSPARGALGGRPETPTTESSGGLQAPVEGMKKLKRKSGLFGGGRSSEEKVIEPGAGPMAWVVGHKGKVQYNLTMLLNGEKVTELWDENGDTLVYLFPRTSGKGPSFRIDSSVYASSRYMTRLIHGRLYSEPAVGQMQLPDRTARRPSGPQYPPSSTSRTASPDPAAPEGSSSDGSKGSRALSDATEDDHSEKHLFMPISLSTDHSPVTPTSHEPRLTSKDSDTLVAYRNFFAFLLGQSLIATERHPDMFDIFMRTADILDHYQFSNVDGSTFGEIAAASFECYVDELGLADCRHSREKTIEAIVIGERMRSKLLYTEGFVHAAGKFDSIKELKHAKFELISHKTVTRIARANMDLDTRVQNINLKLQDFNFPAIFAGIMNSDTADERKMIRFKNWKAAFMSTRSFILDYYKAKYGSWLPKAKSKKNNLTTSGLNRLVLLDMYRDLSSLYDLLVNRRNLTTRTSDGVMSDEDEGDDLTSTVHRALRKVLSEYDRSTPPVQPPIPFDLPLYPELESSKASSDPKKQAKARGKKLKSDEVLRVLAHSHNSDAEQQTPFLEAFRQFEAKQAHGCTLDEIWELRSGQWLFMYAVIQSLPMLVVDVAGVRFTEGVEYFLCEPPRSSVPWGREDTNQARTWFGVAGGSQVVSLPTDIVEHGVEGVYRRSHAWRMASKWSQDDALLNAAVNETINAQPLPPPPGALLGPDSAARSRSASPAGDRRRESVMNLGLEALPLPAGVSPTVANPINMRPASSHDPSKTFDSILQSADLQKGRKKK
ncbi:hypothetical protein EJ04DRAFT_511644 [Polyplosphaeria fusca]|uniref:DUF8004 domain-containing protein n=1 Tax=Polyplosphaeria fusca TaxID=682080 RepID=A0A9P4R3A6_9PLEO|nr:hypothetical protein EJ04DRAFT_511644 [Polyplosphaeria fusca]